MRRLLLAAIALLLAGCAASDAPAPAAGARERRYQATATVLQNRDHGPQLCLTAIALSLPPACEGLPIPNWRWDQVQGEQTAGGTTWGRYRLVGTYDGATFTVTRAALAPPERQPSHQEQFKHEPKPGCPEPAGGWQVPDPARRSERSLEPVTRRPVHFCLKLCLMLSPDLPQVMSVLPLQPAGDSACPPHRRK